jgi:hypothetical protein
MIYSFWSILWYFHTFCKVTMVLLSFFISLSVFYIKFTKSIIKLNNYLFISSTYLTNDLKKQTLDNKAICINLKISQDEHSVPKWQYNNWFRFSFHCKTKCEDTKEVIKICKSYQNIQTQRLEEPGILHQFVCFLY